VQVPETTSTSTGWLAGPCARAPSSREERLPSAAAMTSTEQQASPTSTIVIA
jgi:hypothetical protein